MAVRLNEDKEVVRQIKEGLKENIVRARCADSAQCVLTDKFPRDYRIYGAVQRGENRGKDQRKGVQKIIFVDIAVG